MGLPERARATNAAGDRYTETKIPVRIGDDAVPVDRSGANTGSDEVLIRKQLRRINVSESVIGGVRDGLLADLGVLAVEGPEPDGWQSVDGTAPP